MAQPAQVFATNSPNNTFVVIDNSAAGVVVTSAGTPPSSNNQTGINSDGATLGFDTPTGNASQFAGAQSQGSNPKADTGSVLLDISGNDTVYADPQVGTVVGNPVSLTQPTYKTVTKVLQSALQGINIAWKNPAVWLLSFIFIKAVV
jgi:hypothetical protein